jgi:hypothetical protein
MSLTQVILEEIHLYLSGQMTPDELIAFEKKLREDSTLAQEVALQKRLQNGLRVLAMKNKLKDIASQFSQFKNEDHLKQPVPIRTHRPMRWAYLSIAACTILLLGFWLIFHKQVTNNSTNNPMAVASIHNGTPKTVKSDSTQPSIQPIKEKSVISLATYLKRPEGLVSPFREDNNLGISPSSIAQWETDSLSLVNGVNLLMKKPTVEVIAVFENLEQSKFEGIRQQALWYKTLYYLSVKAYPKALILCKQVQTDHKNTYQNKATQLSTALKARSN